MTTMSDVIAPVIDAFDEALCAQERAVESRKAILTVTRLLDKVSEAVAELPEDFQDVVTVDADVLASMRSVTSPTDDLLPMVKKLTAAVELVGDADGVIDTARVNDLLTRFRALKPTSGTRDGSSRTGSRAFPGVIRLTMPDGRVRNSNGDWTGMRWEARDEASKRGSEIAKVELDTVFQNLKATAARNESDSWTVEDDLGNEYTFEYQA